MTENEQIQEMARLMEEPCVGSCKECEYYAHQFGIPCMDLRRAKIIYTKGYRKVERGEWIETVHDWDFGDYIDYTCSICGIREQNKRKFCPECGADMRKEDEGK